MTGINKKILKFNCMKNVIFILGMLFVISYLFDENKIKNDQLVGGEIKGELNSYFIVILQLHPLHLKELHL